MRITFKLISHPEAEKFKRYVPQASDPPKLVEIGIVSGTSDPDLSEIGKTQAGRLVEYFQGQDVKFNIIYSSPLQRAFYLAKKLCDSCMVEKPAQKKPDLRPPLQEANYGKWQTLPTDEINSTWGEAIAAWKRDEKAFRDKSNASVLSAIGIETFQDQEKRVIRAIEDILRYHIRSSDQDQTIGIVSHRGTIKAVLGYLERLKGKTDFNYSQKMENCTVVDVSFNVSDDEKSKVTPNCELKNILRKAEYNLRDGWHTSPIQLA